MGQVYDWRPEQEASAGPQALTLCGPGLSEKGTQAQGNAKTTEG